MVEKKTSNNERRLSKSDRRTGVVREIYECIDNYMTKEHPIILNRIIALEKQDKVITAKIDENIRVTVKVHQKIDSVSSDLSTFIDAAKAMKFMKTLSLWITAVLGSLIAIKLFLSDILKKFFE